MCLPEGETAVSRVTSLLSLAAVSNGIDSRASFGSPRRTPTQPQQQQYDSRLDDSTALLDGGSILLEGSEGSEGEERMMPADEFVDAYILSYDVAPVKTLRHIHALGWRGIKEGEKER